MDPAVCGRRRTCRRTRGRAMRARRTTSHCSKRRTRRSRGRPKAPRLPQPPRVRSPRTRPRRSSNRGRSPPRPRCRACGQAGWTRRCDQGRRWNRSSGVPSRRDGSWPIIEACSTRTPSTMPSSTMPSSTMPSSTLSSSRAPCHQRVELPIPDGDRLFAALHLLAGFSATKRSGLAFVHGLLDLGLRRLSVSRHDCDPPLIERAANPRPAACSASSETPDHVTIRNVPPGRTTSRLRSRCRVP